MIRASNMSPFPYPDNHSQSIPAILGERQFDGLERPFGSGDTRKWWRGHSAGRASRRKDATTSFLIPPAAGSTPRRHRWRAPRSSACVALRTCSVLPSARRKVAVTRCWPPRMVGTVCHDAGSPGAPLCPQAVPDHLHQLIRQHGDEQGPVGAMLLLVINRTQSQLRLQRPNTASRSVSMMYVRQIDSGSQSV